MSVRRYVTTPNGERLYEYPEATEYTCDFCGEEIAPVQQVVFLTGSVSSRGDGGPATVHFSFDSHARCVPDELRHLLSGQRAQDLAYRILYTH